MCCIVSQLSFNLAIEMYLPMYTMYTIHLLFALVQIQYPFSYKDIVGLYKYSYYNVRWLQEIF